MGTTKDFIASIIRIDGVSDCFLIRNDGIPFAHASKNLKKYSSLMVAGGEFISEIMKISSFGNCRYLSFNRGNNLHFYVFHIDKYLLGVEQCADCYIPDMLKAIFNLIGRVSTSKSDVNQDGS